MRRFVTLLLLLVAAPALAQTDCTLGTAHADLDESDVRARLFNKGNLFWDGGDPYYEVPQGGGVVSIWAAGIWAGGLVDGELRTAAATYAQFSQDYEFFPGPLDAEGNPPEDCTPYDRIWVVSTTDVAAYESTGETTPDLLEWPAELGAPVVDGDGIEGNYDLEAGDRPRVYGSQTAFWVMNDVAGPHLTTFSEPIGLEVRVTAFVEASEDPFFDQATFYRYELHYRGGAPLEDAHFTLWTDPDLGSYTDDYAGTDSTRGLAYVYNADNDDEGPWGYGENPPAVGYDFLSGAGSTIWFFNSGPGNPTAIPYTAEDFYHYMRGQWLDGSPLTEGGDGIYPPGGAEIDFLLPGDPVAPTFWSARCPIPGCATPLPPTDVRGFVISTPAFTLQPGERKTVDFAIVFAQGADHLDSVTELRAASDLVQATYDAGELFDDPVNVSSEGSPGVPAAVRLEAVHPNPVRAAARLTYRLEQNADVRLAVYDVLGRRVAVLADGPQVAGEHRAMFEAEHLASGVYLVVLEANGERQTRKVMLVR